MILTPPYPTSRYPTPRYPNPDTLPPQIPNLWDILPPGMPYPLDALPLIPYPPNALPQIPNPQEGTLYQRYPTPLKGHGTRDTYPPVNRKTPVKTLPSLAVGN